MFEVICNLDFKKIQLDSKIIKVLDNNIIKVEDFLLTDDPYFIKFDKLFINENNSVIYKKLFDNLELGGTIIFYGPNLEEIFSNKEMLYENKHIQIEFIFYFIYNLNYDCEITVDQLFQDKYYNLVENKIPKNNSIDLEIEKLNRTWEVIKTRKDFSRFYINFFSNIKKNKLNDSKLLISIKSKFIKNNINIMFLSQNSNNLKFVKKLALNKKPYYFTNIFTQSEKRYILIDPKKENFLDNLNLIRKINPIKKENIKRELLENVSKLIKEYNKKISLPIYSLKLKDDKPIYKSNLNEYKNDFYKLATVNRYLYDIIIKNQILLEKNYNNFVDKDLILFIKSNFIESIGFLIDELKKIN